MKVLNILKHFPLIPKCNLLNIYLENLFLLMEIYSNAAFFPPSFNIIKFGLDFLSKTRLI